MKITQLFFCLLISLFVFSCKSENKENLTTTVCDTSQARFSVEVKAILVKNCLACHSQESAASFGDGIDLETYTKAKASAQSGGFIASVKHTSAASPMPKGGSKLSDCDIKLLEKWVNDGMKND
jgi:uncharacterized membrane protein